ncbi:MAG TPA: hypothetical protein ENJ05_00295 [Thiotrichales bacterium]|nr:hypothetical protein [Thiotrichales bacterium]
MKITSASDMAMAGIRKGMADVRRSAETVASHPTDAEGVEAAVTLKQAARQVEAASRIIETENEMLGTLLDVKA